MRKIFSIGEVNSKRPFGSIYAQMGDAKILTKNVEIDKLIVSKKMLMKSAFKIGQRFVQLRPLNADASFSCY